MSPLVIAHRTGPRDAPENSLAGIAKAPELGADAVEIDVRRTSDGQPVILHDKWLLRTTLWPLRLNWVSESFATSRRLLGGSGTVPTLAETLAALGSLKVAIDVKDPGAGPAVVSEIRNQGIEHQVLFWSKYEPALKAAVDSGLDFEVTLLRDAKGAEELDRFISDTLNFGARGISAHWSQVDEALAERCRSQGISLYAWCRHEHPEPDKLALLDGLVTDWPTAGRTAVEALPT